MSSKIPTRGPEPWPDQSVEVGQVDGDEVASMFDGTRAVDVPPPEASFEAEEETAPPPSLEEEFFDQNDPYANLTRETSTSPASSRPPAWVVKGRAGLRSAIAAARSQMQGRTFDPVLLLSPAVALMVGLLMGLSGQPWLVPSVAAGVSLALLARVVGVRLLLFTALVLCIFAASWAVPGARPAFWMAQAVLLVGVASGRLR